MTMQGVSDNSFPLNQTGCCAKAISSIDVGLRYRDLNRTTAHVPCPNEDGVQVSGALAYRGGIELGTVRSCATHLSNGCLSQQHKLDAAARFGC